MFKTTCLLLLAAFTASTVAADHVDLVTNPGLMRPDSTFEIRFSSPMVGEDAVGKPAASPPVIVQPRLAGEFKWLSENSGVFRPREAPVLGTTYVFELAPELKTADESPFRATLRHVVNTPAFSIRAHHPHFGNSSNAPALPEFDLLFNAPVDAAKVAPFLRYTNGDGLTIAARVVQANPKREPRHEFPSWAAHGDLLTWTQRFQQSRGLARPEPEGEIANQVHVCPASLLTPGDGWRLIAESGIPALENDLRTLEPLAIDIGKVRPFIVSDVTTDNNINSKRTLWVTLSKAVTEAVTDETAADWIHIEPRPAKLTASVNHHSYQGATITFSADFELNRGYRVTTLAGLPSTEGFALRENHECTVVFQPIEPRIGFEDEHSHQLKSGSRKVQLLSINVPRLRVTAKAFTPDTAAGAADAYAKYSAYRYRNNDDDASRVNVESLPGRMVFQKEYKLPAKADEPDQIAIDWDEILGPDAAGMALITAEALDVPDGRKRPGSQTLIELTDLGVVWKDSASETFLYVFSLKSGAPIAGASIFLLDEKNQKLSTSTTDDTGTTRIPNESRARHLLAQSGTDLNLVRFDYRDHFSHHRFRVQWDGSEEDIDNEFGGQSDAGRQILMFSERPVYKPSETCHVKAIVRDFTPGRPALPAGKPVTLKVTDSRGHEIFSQKLTLSDAGSIAADIKLPSGPLGDYTARLVFPDDAKQQDDDDRRAGQFTFAVQEYKPNAFEILVAKPKTDAEGKATRFDLRAKYYMGKPLSTADVQWSLTATDEAFHPDGFAKFTFCDGGGLDTTRAPEFTDQGRIEIEDGGRASVESKIPFNESAPQPRKVALRCEITDVNQQTVSETALSTLHSSDFYLGIAELPDVLREGDPIPLQVIAVNSDGRPVQEPFETQARLTRVEWQTNRTRGAGYSDRYDSTASFSLCSQAPIFTQPVKKSPSGWIVAGTRAASAAFTVPQPGQYLVEVSARDGGGRMVKTTRSLFVYGRAVTVWNYRNPFQVVLVPDKAEYVSGETATVLVKNPFSGTALVTVERENVRRSFIVKLDGNAPAVRVPIEPGDAPNIYVSILALRGAADSPHKIKMPEYRVGYCALAVKRTDAKLVVSAQPSHSAYRPGEAVDLRVEVRSEASEPVANAEVTLYAVDEGVLSLMGYETPDPYAFFNRRRALGVDTGLTLPDLKSEDPADRVFGNKGYLIGDGGESVSLRKNFLACAYWNASLRTDATGQVHANFTAPDSLTRYRVIAVVATARDQFGSAESAFEVNKPVMIEPATTRFGNVGDHVIARAVIHNTTALAGEAEVRLQTDDTARSTAFLSTTIQLQPGASVPVDFPLDLVEVGDAVWKFTVHFRSGDTRYTDAVENRLKIGFPAPMLRQIVQGRATTGETDLLAGIAPTLLNGHGVIRVSYSNSRVVELRESLSQLLHYPYGCVEQTTSSTLPWIGMRGISTALPELQRPETEVAAAIQHGVDRLLSMQTESGGLAYWPGGTEPLLYASAWGGFGIASGRKAGASVPEEDFQRLMTYLANSLRGAGDARDIRDASSQCLALFTLAVGGKPQPAYHELFFARRSTLDPQQRAWLALAILESKGPSSMVDALLDDTSAAPDDASWWWCASRTTSTRLMAWTRHKPDGPMVERLVTQLLASRTRGHWYTTQGNAWAVLALGDYVQRAEKAEHNIAGEFVFNGKARSFALGEKAVCLSEEFTLRPGEVPTLALRTSGTAPVFTNVTVEVRPTELPGSRGAAGYSIRRSYEKVLDDGSVAEAKDLRVGDRVLVTLDVNVPREATYLAIEDPMPAVFEAINPEFKSQAATGANLAREPWQCNFHELREDRALFFVDYARGGEYQIRYLARVRAAGTATAAACKVEEMYEPDRFATSDTRHIRAEKWD